MTVGSCWVGVTIGSCWAALDLSVAASRTRSLLPRFGVGGYLAVDCSRGERWYEDGYGEGGGGGWRG